MPNKTVPSCSEQRTEVQQRFDRYLAELARKLSAGAPRHVSEMYSPNDFIEESVDGQDETTK